MNVLMPEQVGKAYRNRLDLLLAIQEVGKESGWDYVSQQMETSETLARLVQVQIKEVASVKMPCDALEDLGRGVVACGKTILGHTIASTEIARLAERQTMELLVDHWVACLEGKVTAAFSVDTVH